MFSFVRDCVLVERHVCEYVIRIRHKILTIRTYIPLTLYTRRGISIFIEDAYVLPKLLRYEEYCRRDRW
jgi:hypothetical protein